MLKYTLTEFQTVWHIIPERAKFNCYNYILVFERQLSISHYIHNQSISQYPTQDLNILTQGGHWDTSSLVSTVTITHMASQ